MSVQEPPPRKKRHVQKTLDFFPTTDVHTGTSVMQDATSDCATCIKNDILDVSPACRSEIEQQTATENKICNESNDGPMTAHSVTRSTISAPCSSQSIPEVPFHPPKDFKFPKTSRMRTVTDKIGNAKQITESRSCQHKWFEKWSFLHYDVESDSLFCHSCAHATYNKHLFVAPESSQVFVNTGYKNFHDPNKGIKKHINSKSHKDSVLKLANLQQKPIDEHFKFISDEQQAKARKYLRILFSCIKYLTQQGFPLRGHSDDDGPLYNLMKERIHRDHPDLMPLLKKRDNWLSHDIQNEIIQSFAHAIQRSLGNEIRKSEWVGTVADGTTDMSGKEQLSVCVQYVNSDTLQPENVFMGLYNSPDSRGKTLAFLVKDVFIRNGISIREKLCGFAFDGASNMSGAYNGAKAVIKEECPDALHIHCSNHALDLGLQEVARNNTEIANALLFVKESSNLIRESSKRRDLFLNVDEGDSQMLLSICPTRWCVRAKAMDRVLANYQSLIGALKEISEDCGARGEARAKAKGLHKQALNKDMYFYILAGHNIFCECEIVAKQLQSKEITANECLELIENLKRTLQRFRGDDYMQSLMKKTDNAADRYGLVESEKRLKCTPGRIRFEGKKKMEERLSTAQKYRANFFYVVDLLTSDICRRFEQKDLHVAAAREKLLLTNELTDIDNSTFSDLYAQSQLPASFEKCKLQRHLLQMKDLMQLKNTTFGTVHDVAKALTGMGHLTRQLYSEVERLVNLILSQPVSVAQCERSFSCLRRLKNFLRTSMSQARLTHLAVIAIHKNRLDSVDVEILMNEFVERTPERRSIFGIAL